MMALLGRSALRLMTGLTRLNRGPLYLIHFVTLRCNAKCAHCFLPINSQADELTLEEIERCTSAMPPLLYLSLTGGEPLLRTDLAEIVAAYARGPAPQIINVNTNGTFPSRTEELARTIATQYPQRVFSIGVSFDGVGPTHDEARGVPGLFDKALETMQRLRAVEARQPNFRADVVFTLTPDNQHDAVEHLRRIEAATGTGNIFLNVQRQGYGPGGAPGIEPACYAAAQSHTEQRSKRSGALASVVRGLTAARNRLIAQALASQSFSAPCLAGRLSGVIACNGEVFACELRNEMMGSLRAADDDLAAIWRTDEAVSLRRKISQQRCFCTHECFNTVNVLFRPRTLLRHWPGL